MLSKKNSIQWHSLIGIKRLQPTKRRETTTNYEEKQDRDTGGIGDS